MYPRAQMAGNSARQARSQSTRSQNTRSQRSRLQETAFLSWLQQWQPTHPSILHGIGDDAAVLQSSRRPLVVTADLICDGVHFDSRHCSAAQIGRKALAVNLSDVAAMAAIPIAAFVSLALPSGLREGYAQELMQAMGALAREFDCAVAGGDTNVWGDRMAINVTLLGESSAKGPLLRSGARPGDVLLVTGSLGGSLMGHHFNFVPRVREATLLHDRFELRAGMDLSDGLAIDLRRLVAASGCGAEVNGEAIPISSVVREGAGDRASQLRQALGDGEDFELLIAADPEQAQRILEEQPLSVPITAIGRCTDVVGQLDLVTSEGRFPMPDVGYQHSTHNEGNS